MYYGKNISELIFLSAKRYKEKKFIKFLNDDQFISFQDLENLKNNLNIYFSKLQIKKKQKIAILLDNSPLLILFYLLIPASFRIFVPLNPNAGEEEIQYIINITKPKIIFFDKKFSFKIKKIKISKIKINNENNFINKLRKIKIDDYKSILSYKQKNCLAQILFTSGSTGNPKGVPTTHKNIITNLEGIIDRLVFSGDNNNFLSCTPLYHNSGQTVPTLVPLALGQSTYTIPPLQGLSNFANICNKKKINYSLMMPTHINYLNSLKKRNKLKFMKFLCVGGAKLHAESQKKFQKKFNTRIYTDYGLTETSSIASSEGPNITKYGTVGKPLFNNNIIIKKFRKENFGEILIKGPNVFSGYYKNFDITKKKLKRGYLNTGDIGWIDEDGFLFIKDRIDDMINVSGENIYPSEIERHVNNFKNIKISAVLGIKDQLTDNKLCLIYEATNSKKIDSHKLINYLSDKISKFKIPKIFFEINEIGLNEIPKAPNKKILRKKLKDYFSFFLKNSRILE